MTTTTTPAAPSPAPRKKSSMGKLILKLVALLFILLIVAVVLVFLNLNTLVKMGVIRGGKYATDQDTNLNAADLSLSAGSLQLNDFAISNLTGYTAPNILTMKSCSTTVQSSTIFSSTVVVNTITIDGLEVTLEQNGMKNNLNDLMQIIQKKTAATGSAPAADGSAAPPGNTPPGKELKIAVLKLTGTKVHLVIVRFSNLNQTIALPDIEMDDPTNPDGRPMKIADLIGKILLQLSKQIVDNPQIPSVIKDGMKNVTALVDNLRGQLDKGLKGLPDLQGVTTQLGNVLNQGGVKDLGQNLGNQTKDLGKNLGGLFGQKK